MFRIGRTVLLCLVFAFALPQIHAQGWSLNDHPELAAFFEEQVAAIETRNELTQVESLEAWEQQRPRLREELFDMLGLSPRPPASPLQPEVTAVTEHEEFVVERLHFQSVPGLYVTANLYRPKEQDGPLPAVLYVCGHGRVKEDGVSFGNKAYYQHHGAWFARNGYVCLTIDTLQLGEIEGVHHGTYNLNRWWWNSRGYTPAGVEAWNCIRALDYLQTRTEVDSGRMGVTGRSGGGAYSWWIAALDDRIQCAVPVAGITSMRDYVVHGCVEGHCDCMFMVNFHRWNFAKVAALVAPRPLLISNTDKDRIFPLEGVIDVHRQTRHIYRLYGAEDRLGLQITEGPHKDTQELHIHAFRWFNRHFRNTLDQVETTAVKFFAPQQLQVFQSLPKDQKNTQIDEIFVPAADVPNSESVIADADGFISVVRNRLRDRCFGAWPADGTEQPEPVGVSTKKTTSANTVQTTIRFESQRHVPLAIDVLHAANASADRITSLRLSVFPAVSPDTSGPAPVAGAAHAAFAVRPGITGPWDVSVAKQNQIRRRFQLIGTTLGSMRVWDLRQAIRVVRTVFPNLRELHLESAPGMESVSMLAALYEEGISSLTLPSLKPADDGGPDILNLSRTVSLQILPVVSALRMPITTQSASADAPLLWGLQQRDDWPGHSVHWAEQ